MNVYANYRIFWEDEGWAFELLRPDGSVISKDGGFKTRQRASGALMRRLDDLCAALAPRKPINPVTDPNAFARLVLGMREPVK